MLAKELNVLPLANGELRLEITLADQSCGTHLAMLSACGKLLEVEVKPFRKKKSVSANSYMWVILAKMAVVLLSTKEDVYREAVRKVGLFSDHAIPDKYVDRDIRRHTAKGEGYSAEVTEKAQRDGYKVVRFYYGSSCYDSKEISVLIEYIVDEAKEMGVETMPDDEYNRLMDKIGAKNGTL